MTDTKPTVSAIIATRDRPELLREAIAAVRGQNYDAKIETIVVFDRSQPDLSLGSDDPLRPVRVVSNTNSPGLPGARNCGVGHSTGRLLAFCDDDDYWLEDKTARSVDLLAANPDAEVAVCALSVDFRSTQDIDRSLPSRRITFEDLLASRVMEANFVTALVRREAYVNPERIGPADENIPGGYGEDYEWMLRAARRHDIVVDPTAQVVIRWTGGSWFAERWATIDQGLAYLMERFPEFERSRTGSARILGQRAFANAAQRERGEAWRLIASTLRHNPTEPRAALAAAVNLRLVSPDTIVRALNKRGRGI